MDIEKELNELKAKMTPINTAKFLAGTLISLAAAAAVVGAMRGSLSGARGITKLLMKLGIFVLACKAGDVAETYFRDKVKEAEDDYAKMKQEGLSDE